MRPSQGCERMAVRVVGSAVAAAAVLLASGAAAAPAGAVAPADGLPAAGADAWAYRVEPGDTLIGIAATQLGPGHSWRPLQRLNRVANPRRLMPGSTLRLPLAWLKLQPVQAEVLHVQGEVQVQRATAAAGAAPEPLAAGALLGSGDLVSAGPEAALALKLRDGSRLLVRPSTRMRFEQLVEVGATGVPQTRLRLEGGGLDSQVPPGVAGRRYDIGTPTVNLGVRGTAFRTQVDPGATRVEVIEGRVAALSESVARVGVAVPGRSSTLEAGYGSVIAPGQPATLQKLLPAPDLAPLAARLERVPLRLAWAPLAGAQAYRAQVFPAEGAEAEHRLLLDGRFDEPAARWQDLPDGRYELRVRGIGAAGLEGLDARRSFVLKARPEPPFIVQPRADARLYGDAALLNWTRAEGIGSYRLQLSDSADFAAPRIDLAGLTGSEQTLALPPGRYHWRMASVRPDGDAGPFGDALTFTLRPVPPAPPVAPPQVSGDAIVLRWPEGGPGQRYELQLARDSAFTDLVQTQASDKPEATLALPPPGRYQVRVRAIDADGYVGPWGAPQLVEVPQSRWWLLLPALLLLLAL